jgi:membrane protease YdiL (CAAX protease family)
MKEKIKKVLLGLIFILLIIVFIQIIVNIAIIAYNSDHSSLIKSENVENNGIKYEIVSIPIMDIFINLVFIVFVGGLIYELYKRLFLKKKTKEIQKEKIKKSSMINILVNILFLLHFLCMLFAISFFIVGNWQLGILSIIIAGLFVYLSYRFDKGILSPILLRDYWPRKDLYECLSYVVTSRKAQISFSRYENQKPYLNRLELIGLKKKPNEDIRQFIMKAIVTDRKAFDILRNNIIIKTFYKNKFWFWDGYGKMVPPGNYEDAIYFAINQDILPIFTKKLEGLETEDLKKQNIE